MGAEGCGRIAGVCEGSRAWSMRWYSLPSWRLRLRSLGFGMPQTRGRCSTLRDAGRLIMRGTALRLGLRRTLPRIRALSKDRRGQSTVEAAALLMVLALLLALLVQPVCMSYTHTVMRHAAAEAIRVAATSKDDEVVRSFVQRRLEAVPSVCLFHVGGKQDWHIDIFRATDARTTTVCVSGHLRPLPVLGAVATMACKRDSVGVCVEESVTSDVRPEWLEGDYESWMSCW